MKLEYYPLDKIEKTVNFSVDELIQLGGLGKLNIHILTSGFVIEGCEIVSDVHDIRRFNFRRRYMQLMPECLARLDSHNDTDVIIEREPIFSYKYEDFDSPEFIEFDSKYGKFRCYVGYTHYNLKRECFYPTVEMLADYMRHGGNIDDITPPPIKISECKMVVLHDDLEQFRQSLTPDLIPGQKQVEPQKENLPKYKRREIDCNAWIKDTQVNVIALSNKKIHDQLKSWSENKPLWENIKTESFVREFWSRYSTEYNIIKPPGRPKKI